MVLKNGIKISCDIGKPSRIVVSACAQVLFIVTLQVKETSSDQILHTNVLDH